MAQRQDLEHQGSRAALANSAVTGRSPPLYGAASTELRLAKPAQLELILTEISLCCNPPKIKVTKAPYLKVIPMCKHR